jgi:hypothetical protein
MLRIWFKWVLFANSYTPFFLILLIRDFGAGAGPWKGAWSWSALWHVFGMPGLSWLLVAVILVSNTFLWFFLKGFVLASQPLQDFKSIKSKASDALSYVVTYIIGFLKFDPQKDLLPLAILLIVIGVIYVHSNLLATNPMLSLAGYRAYELAAEGDEAILLLTRKGRNEIKRGLPVVQVTEDIYVEVRP